ncbi:MAG: aromatic ring-hydroxylating dioxygenase subunit alpha [Gammaproteobacteria bacterium]|nr:aromatic ring-hydroxylating dioxygenase subunit alpha [Gammaproteobacteria bacterium]
MLINFWYPAERSEALKADAPLRVQMLGLPFVLWRDSAGRAHCASNTCPHRGGSLGDGKVVGDCIQCPYHGWKFAGDGSCARIPSLGPIESLPPASRLDAYPVEERYGLVFVFLGDLPEGQRPTIMPCAEYGQPAWRTLAMNYRWRCNYVRLVENQSDPSHVEYVHAGFGMAGKDTQYKVPKINVQEGGPWSAGAMVVFYSPALPDQDMRRMQAEGRNESGSGYHGAASTWTRVNFNATDKMYIYLYAVPRDELDLEIYLVMQRNCMLEERYDENFLRRMGVAVEEDRIVIEKLDPAVPEVVPLGEFVVPADDIILHYRARLADWHRRGWRIDCGRLAAMRGRVACAIPSPARRLQPVGWAVAPVPLLAN